MGSDPRIWGEALWKTLHRFSLAYPRNRPSAEQQKAARDFYQSIKYLLPCPFCTLHYSKHFDETFNEETVKSRAALVKWVFDLHNAVNKRLGKPIPNITVDDLPRLYNSFPLRYVDLKTGTLLQTPRYLTTEGRDCPMDEQDLKQLQKQWQDNSTASTDQEKKIQSSLLAATIPSSTLPKTTETSFWLTPTGVSLIWIISLAAVAAVVGIILFVQHLIQKKHESLKPSSKVFAQENTGMEKFAPMNFY